MTEISQADAAKHGSEIFLPPDDWYSIEFSSSATGTGDGYSNNGLVFTELLDQTLPQAREQRACNDGLFSRMCTSTPMIVDKITNNSFGWATLGTAAQAQIVQQHGRGAFIETPLAAAGALAGTWIYMLKIRLTDLHPLFKELDLLANPQLKIRYRVNSGTTEILGTTTTMSLGSTTMTSGNVCPIIVASAVANNPMNGVLSNTAGSKISFAFGALRNAHSETSTIAEYLPYTTTRLHIPFYDLIDPRPIISKPIKTVRYLDCFAQYFKGRAGTGVIAGQQNAAFNFQLSASLKNVKYVALIPYAETTTGHFVVGPGGTAGGTEQFQSPFDSAPWTCQPGASVRNFQVQIGNQNVFAKTHEYDYESFIHEFSKLGAINGDITREMNNGLVNIDRWTFAQRIMIADCSRITEKDVPTALQVSGINSCSQGSNYLILAVYERELQIDRLTGEIPSFD